VHNVGNKKKNMEGQKWRASEKKPVKLSLAEDVITHETAFFGPSSGRVFVRNSSENRTSSTLFTKRDLNLSSHGL
jgi:hypothetical protein